MSDPISFSVFRNMVQAQVNNLPSEIKTAVLNKVQSIYIEANVLDDNKKALNDEEYALAQTKIDTLINALKESYDDKVNKNISFGLSGDMQEGGETIKDGSRFTKQLEQYKALDSKYDELNAQIKARALELGLYDKDKYFEKTSDEKLVNLCNELDKITAEQDKIYSSIEKAISNSPKGTKFQCGDYVISHKRAYTDVDGKDRMLVFEKL